MESQPTLFLHENVIGFPTALLREVLSEVYDIDEVILSPTDAGFPIDRLRKYCICVKRTVAKLLGFLLTEQSDRSLETRNSLPATAT